MSISSEMPPHFSLVPFKGKTYLFNDYTGMKEKEVVPAIKEGTAFITEMGDPDLRILIDVKGTPENRSIHLQFLKAALEVKPYSRKIAVVGQSNFQRIILKGINRMSGVGARPFKSLEEARVWLLEE